MGWMLANGSIGSPVRVLSFFDTACGENWTPMLSMLDTCGLAQARPFPGSGLQRMIRR